MHTFKTTTLSSLLLLPFISAQVQSASNCTVFTWDQQPPYLIYDTSFPRSTLLGSERISAGSSCPSASNASHSCALVASGDVQVLFTHNLSLPFINRAWNTPTGVEDFLHALILPQINASLSGAAWNESIIGAVDTVQPLAPGESGYIAFVPLMRCVVGTMSNCTGELRDGLGVEACAPVYHEVGRKAVLDGNFSVVEMENATAYSDPFAQQSSGGGDEGAGTALKVSAGALGTGLVAALGFALLL